MEGEAGRVAEATAWLRRGRETLDAARVLAREGYHTEAISRGYYAMFYAARALLTSRGILLHKHSAVVTAFGREFVRSGLIDQAHHRALLDAFRDRQASDHFVDIELSAELVAHRLEQATSFIDAIVALLAAESQ